MSFSIWHDYGYGIKTDDIHTDLLRLKQLIKLAPEYERWISDYFQDCEIEEPTCKDYMEIENDESQCGLNTILWSVITENEDMEFSAMADCNGVRYLFFSVGYPWGYSEKEKRLSERDIEQVLHKYVSVLTDEAIDIDYQSIENCG